MRVDQEGLGDKWGRLVRMARRDDTAGTGKEACLAPRVPRVNLVPRGCLAFQETREREATRGLMDPKVPQERME